MISGSIAVLPQEGTWQWVCYEEFAASEIKPIDLAKGTIKCAYYWSLCARTHERLLFRSLSPSSQQVKSVCAVEPHQTTALRVEYPSKTTAHRRQGFGSLHG